jgi:hypothetical protein
MARSTKGGSRDGIEIHWDDRSCYLSLACEPDAFERFRSLAKEQLKDLPELPVERAETIEPALFTINLQSDKSHRVIPWV